MVYISCFDDKNVRFLWEIFGNLGCSYCGAYRCWRDMNVSSTTMHIMEGVIYGWKDCGNCWCNEYDDGDYVDVDGMTPCLLEILGIF